MYSESLREEQQNQLKWAQEQSMQPREAPLWPSDFWVTKRRGPGEQDESA